MFLLITQSQPFSCFFIVLNLSRYFFDSVELCVLEKKALNLSLAESLPLFIISICYYCINDVCMYVFCIYVCLYIYIYIYIYIASWPAVVEGDPRTPFSWATTPRSREGLYSFPWIAPLVLDLYLIVNVGKNGLSYLNSNIEQGCLHSPYEKSINPTALSPAMGEYQGRLGFFFSNQSRRRKTLN